MGRYSKEELMRMPLEDFSEPATRSGFIADQQDLMAAFHRTTRLGDRGAACRRIIAIAKRKGLRLPPYLAILALADEEAACMAAEDKGEKESAASSEAA